MLNTYMNKSTYKSTHTLHMPGYIAHNAHTRLKNVETVTIAQIKKNYINEQIDKT